MSEELKKLEEILANDRKIIEDNYKEIERLNKELESKNKVIDAMIDNEEEYCIEINRLNNIINELEEHLKSEIKTANIVWENEDKEQKMQVGLIRNTLELTLDKLQELKGEDK